MSISEDIERFIPSEKLVKLTLKNIVESPSDEDDIEDGIIAVQTYVGQCMRRELETVAFRAIAMWEDAEAGEVGGIKVHSMRGGVFVLEELEDGRVIIRISKNKKFTDDMATELSISLELNKLKFNIDKINEIIALLHDELANFINNDGDMFGNWGKLKIDSIGMYIELLKRRPRKYV